MLPDRPFDISKKKAEGYGEEDANDDPELVLGDHKIRNQFCKVMKVDIIFISSKILLRSKTY